MNRTLARPLVSLIFLLFFSTLSFAGPGDEHRQRTIQGLGDTLDESAANFMRGQPGDTIAGINREVSQLRIGHQHGLGYLPLMIVRQLGLIEKQARNLGLTQLNVIWSRYPSGSAMNSALQTGFLDLAAGSISAMLKAWDRNTGDQNIVGLSALSSMPLYLNVLNQKVRTIEDLSRNDRIAMPSSRDSTQALLLRMAVADRLGIQHANALDGITVNLSHPLAMQYLLERRAGITAHFASPPFQFEELENPQVRTILSSQEVMGGPFSFSLLWSREAFQEENPLTTQAVQLALGEAIRVIESHPQEAASIYVLQSQSSLEVETVKNILTNPVVRFGLLPENTQHFAERMHELGELSNVPENWAELFGPSMQSRPGS